MTSPAPYPLGPFDPDYLPELLAADPGPSSAERGWTGPGNGGLKRYLSYRKLVSTEREVEILRLHHRGVERGDIAEQLGISYNTVGVALARSMKKALNHAGAEKERVHQLELTDKVIARLMARIDPDPILNQSTGEYYTPPVDVKAVDSLAKILSRRAELTGANMPTKHEVKGQVEHTGAIEIVDKTNAYMDLIDQVMATGFGSGRAPGDKQAELVSDTNIIDAEVVEDEVGDQGEGQVTQLRALPSDPDPDDGVGSRDS